MILNSLATAAPVSGEVCVQFNGFAADPSKCQTLFDKKCHFYGMTNLAYNSNNFAGMAINVSNFLTIIFFPKTVSQKITLFEK